MFNQILRFIERHRLPIPDRFRLPAKYRSAVFLSSFLIAFGALMVLFAAVLGVQLFSQPAHSGSKATKAEIDQVAFEMRAHVITSLAREETLMFRKSLQIFHLTDSQQRREEVMRQAKDLRANALQHLIEAEAIALPADKQPDIAALRAEIAELDRQLAVMPGTQGN